MAITTTKLFMADLYDMLSLCANNNYYYFCVANQSLIPDSTQTYLLNVASSMMPTLIPE